MPLKSCAGVNVITPVVESMLTTPSLAGGMVASASVNGAVPVGAAGVNVSGVLAVVVPLTFGAAGGAGRWTDRSMVAQALTSSNASVAGWAIVGTSPWNPAAGVKVMTPVVESIVAVPSPAGAFLVIVYVKGPVPIGPPVVTWIAPGPLPDPMASNATGLTVSAAVALDVRPYASVAV